jgi:hypothetical protein
MNRFEALLAPPSLNPKDLAIHIRMHPEIPKEVSGACRTELVNVETRLHDELTTVRFGRQLTATEPADYRDHCARLTGSRAEPIEFRFFAEPYAASASLWPSAGNQTKFLQAVRDLTDAWLVQAWAAQALRIAQAAESSDPQQAKYAWRTAIRLYEAFFDRARASESYTYRLQTDASAQGTCVEAWDNFLADEMVALKERLDRYGQEQRGAAVAACLEVFALREAAPYAPAGVLDDAVAVFAQGIAAATSLEAAVAMYLDCPAALCDQDQRQEVPRALLGAMAREVGLLEKGFGDVTSVVNCAEELGPPYLDPGRAGGLLRVAQAEFFDACATYARHALNDELPFEVRQRAADLLQHLPAEWEIGKGSSGGQTILRDGAVEQLLMKDLAPLLEARIKALMDAPRDSAAEESAVDAVIAFAQEHAMLAAGPQTSALLAQALGLIFKNAAGDAGGDQSSRGWRVMEKIQRALPASVTADIGGKELTLAKHLEAMRRGELPPLEEQPQFATLVKQLMDAPAGAVSEQKALTALIDFARAHREFVSRPAETELLGKALLAIFRNSAGQYLEEWKDKSRCLDMMRQIADFMPSQTRVALGDEAALPLAEQIKEIRALAALHVANEAPVGSSQERAAAEELGRLLAEGVDFAMGDKRFGETARRVLMGIASANQGRSDGSSLTVTAAKAALAGATGRAPSPKTGRATTRSRSSSQAVGAAIGRVVGIVLVLVIYIGVPIGLWQLASSWNTWAKVGLVAAYFIVFAIIGVIVGKKRS